MFCLFLHLFCAVLDKTSAISFSDNCERRFINSFVHQPIGGRALKRGSSMVYCPCILVSNQIYHQLDGTKLLASSKFGQRRLVMKI